MKILLYHCEALCNPQAFAQHFARMPESRRKKIDALKNESDKRLSLGAGIVLEELLQGCNTDAIAYGEHGKPYLPGSPLHFNLSHSGTLALGVSAPCSVGCDVQKIKPVSHKIAARFFTAYEQELLAACENETAFTRLFYRLWTLKESAVKALGTGIAALEQIEIRFENDLPQPITLPWGATLYFKEYFTDMPYAIAVCAMGDAANAECRMQNAEFRLLATPGQ